jgi:hypothetical protein
VKSGYQDSDTLLPMGGRLYIRTDVGDAPASRTTGPILPRNLHSNSLGLKFRGAAELAHSYSSLILPLFIVTGSCKPLTNIYWTAYFSFLSFSFCFVLFLFSFFFNWSAWSCLRLLPARLVSPPLFFNLPNQLLTFILRPRMNERRPLLHFYPF